MATSIIETIRETAQTHATDACRQVGSLGKLDYVRQGDVYFWSLDKVPSGCRAMEKPDWQLAPGTTQGSRHIVAPADRANVTVLLLPHPNPLQGPVLDAPHGVTIEHPEHGHVRLGSGVYLVTYQRAYAEELRRVQD